MSVKTDWRMCPNEACESYRVATRLLGGCECGSALVAYATEVEPTNEQLARLVSLFATQTPEVPNVSVEMVQDLLDRKPELQRFSMAVWRGLCPA